MFRDSLAGMVDRLAGGVAGILMGFDGIAVDSYTKSGEESLDIQTIGMELAHVVVQMRKAAEQIQIRQDRMAHASEIIGLIGKLGLKVAEAPVTILYTEYSLRKGQKLSNAFNILSELFVARLSK